MVDVASNYTFRP